MQLFANLIFRALVVVQLHFYIALHISLSLRPVDQQRRQLAVRFYSRWYYVRSGVGESARGIIWAMNRFYTKQTKIFGPKYFRIWFFLKVLKKLFVVQKINLEDTLIHGRGWRQRVPKSLIGQTECENETRRTMNQKLILPSFIFVWWVVMIH